MSLLWRTASDQAQPSVSPSHYGFIPRPEEEWQDAMANTDYQDEREISTDHPLHSGQDEMFPHVVDHYAQNPDSEHVYRDPIDRDYPHDPPQVYRYVGDDDVTRDYVGEGHHRIAAARQRGDRTIKVAWHEFGWHGSR